MTNVTRALVPGCMALFLMLWASPLHAAEEVSWAGTWKLNLEKSDFGKDPKPKEIIVKIDDRPRSIQSPERMIKDNRSTSNGKAPPMASRTRRLDLKVE